MVALIASLSLKNGFSGDQALFLTYSKAISHGAILYKDVWDIKQPAIMVFYLIGGELFGFTEVGIHLFETIYWLCLCIIMIVGLRKYFKSPLFAALTPLFTVGIYYSVSGSLHLTQAEGLVCFPLFLSLFFCQKFLESPDKLKLMFLSGLFGGIVLLFKLMFILVLIPLWLGLLFYCYFLFFHKNAKKSHAVILSISLGLFSPIAVVIFYFALNGALSDLWYTTFVYPFEAVTMVTKMENRNEHLKSGLVWFFKSYFPIIALSFVLLILNAKNIFDIGRKKVKFALRAESFIFVGLFIWFFAGLTVVLLQKLSWWEYHYTLLMLPMGILAVKGVERLFDDIRSAKNPKLKTPAFIVMAVVFVLLFVPTARRLTHKVVQARQVEMIKIGDREFGVTGDAAEDYRSISAESAFLKKDDPNAAIFVVSNPLFYYLTDSMPLFASNGAMIDMFTEFEWKRLNSEMTEKPPKYIYIETRLLGLITEEDPAFMHTVDTKYSVHSKGERGAFYKIDH